MRCKIRYQVINGVSLLSQRCKRLSDLIGLCNIICCRELFCKRFRIVLQRLLARLYLFLWPVPPLNIQKPLNRFFIISVSCNLPRIPLNNGIGRNILCNNSARMDNCSAANMNAPKYDDVLADLYIMPDNDLIVIDMEGVIRYPIGIKKLLKWIGCSPMIVMVHPDLKQDMPRQRSVSSNKYVQPLTAMLNDPVRHIGTSAYGHEAPAVLMQHTSLCSSLKTDLNKHDLLPRSKHHTICIWDAAFSRSAGKIRSLGASP